MPEAAAFPDPFIQNEGRRTRDALAGYLLGSGDEPGLCRSTNLIVIGTPADRIVSKTASCSMGV
jgi:hypothetical protein